MSHTHAGAAPAPLFSDLGLDPQLLQAITEEGYVTPTPIQAGAIPAALSGRDVLGCAQTGTGKTAAFGLPILHRLSNTTFARDPRALVLTPTRELAMQCEEFLRAYGRHSKLRTVCIVGGMPMRPQIKAVQAGCDVVIATPGRLLDLEHQRVLHLSRVEILVLDEADRMLDMGFIPDIRHIMRLLTAKNRQTLLFSATMPSEIAHLAFDLMRDPVKVEVAPPATPVDKVRQVAHPVEPHLKDALVKHLLQAEGWDQVLIFTRTKRCADVLCDFLSRAGESVGVIHGDLHQKARLRALADFKNKDIKVLVATDVAARGLDIEDISHVVNYDLPDNVEDYIHRIGRTARASADGDAVSLASFRDWMVLEAIEKETGIAIPRVPIEGFVPDWYTPQSNEPKPPTRRRRMLRGGRRR